MITTAGSRWQGGSTGFRYTAYLILGFAISATLVFADDGSPMRVTHVLGLDGIAKKSDGNVSIREGALQFSGRVGQVAKISLGSIVDVTLGEQDKQVGGVPMALGQAATPFGGGRVIALFSHKRYDTLTVEYLDTNGGLHGAIFQLNKGQAQVVRNELVSAGAHFAAAEDPGVKRGAAEIKHENR
jgi:hypothetical protein